MKKNIIKIIIFLLILYFIIYILFKILWITPTSISYFYDEPKKSLDIVYIGSSNAFVHFNTTLAYNLYGYTTGMLSAASQPFVLTEYLIKESEKYQKPSLYIIDISKIAKKPYDEEEGNVRKNIDSMKFSLNRINAVTALLDGYEDKIDQKDYINWYLSFLMYHNKWKNISVQTIAGNKTLYKGYFFSNGTAKIVPQNTNKWSENMIELQDKNKQILMNLINYIKNNNLNVLFVVPNKVYEKEESAKINGGIQILQENGMNIINFNTIQDLNINFDCDLYNNEHLNVYGATKYTLYFSKYLKENYQLEDHRGDKKYDLWTKEYERFKKDFKKITNKDFDELL